MFGVKTLLGMDLGHQNDYTVLSALDIAYQSVTNAGYLYKLVYLRKFPLKTGYPAIVNWVDWFLTTNYKEGTYLLIVDYTGVGMPVLELFRERNFNLLAIGITGGSRANWKGKREVTVPKKELITSLLVTLQNYRLKIASDIDHLEDLKKEILNFKYKLGHSKATPNLEAAHGFHDDIVISISMPTWYGEYTAKRAGRGRIFSR